MVGAKRKRVSKNKKANWRKHSNIQDVEEYLDDVRLQERTGGLVAEKSDAQLFFIDKKFEDGVPKGKKKKLVKPLKCHSALLPDPNIKPARIQHNVKTSQKYTMAAQRTSARQKQMTTNNASTSSVPSKPLYDLWGDDANNNKDNAIDEVDDGHYSRVTRRKPVKLPPKIREKTSAIRPVEVPHPGASYNPTYEDHQDLLREAHEIEVEKLRDEMRVVRALDEKFPGLMEAPTEESYLQEMSAGLNDAESDSDGDGNNPADLDRLSVNPPVNRESKKTQTQRNKERARKEQEMMRKRKKQENIKKDEFNRVKSIKKQLNKAEAVTFKRQFKRALRQKQKADGTRKLGKLKFDAPDIELKLSDEVEGSFRLLKPEGNLIEDRFKSLQKRNLIEPRIRAKIIKKYKRKTFEKKSHREVTL